MAANPGFPLVLDVKGWPVLVIGGDEELGFGVIARSSCSTLPSTLMICARSWPLATRSASLIASAPRKSTTLASARA